MMLASATEFAVCPYPGERPPGSFIVDDDLAVIGVEASGTAPSRWTAAGADLDDWLARRRAPRLGERVAVLSYGSNACPAKQVLMAEERGLRLPVVNLASRVFGHAAVWTAGRRQHDRERVATLTPLPGHVEPHVVSLIHPDDLYVLDRMEGRPRSYERDRMPTGSVVLENGEQPIELNVYLGQVPRRSPLLVSGKPVLVFGPGGTITADPDPSDEEPA